MARVTITELPVVTDNSQSSIQRLVTRLYELLRQTATQLNGLSEGAIAVQHASRTSIPIAGTYKQGDKIADSLPVEAGLVGVKYVRIGWVCVASGTPGTWREMRVLTGN